MTANCRIRIVAMIGCIGLAGLTACSGKGSAAPAAPPGGPGAPAPVGDSGNSCSIRANGDGTSTIGCTDGTSATITTSKAATACTIAGNGNATRTITCGTDSITVASSVLDYNLMNATELADAQMSAVATLVDIPADGRPVVSLKVSTRKGDVVKNLSSTAASWRFALLKLVPGSSPLGGPVALGLNGSANDTWVSYMAKNATSTASTETAVADSLTDNGDGSYSYRFAQAVNAPAAAGSTYDAAATHRLVLLLSATNNPFSPVNLVKDFIPSTGTDVTGQNDKVDPASCLSCHVRFRAGAQNAGGVPAFHGGTRYDVRVCAACHNDQRRFTALNTGTTPSVDLDAPGILDPVKFTWTGNAALINGEAFDNLPVFIHKIHRGENLSLRGGSYTAISQPFEIHYPQAASNCTKCHTNTALADNWKNKPSRRACGSCHDDISFATAVPAGRKPHPGGAAASDQFCVMCHKPGSATEGKGVDVNHVSVLPPDPDSTFSGGVNGNTNASYLAAAGAVPAGAAVITYKVSSVSRNPAKNPLIVFQLLKNGTPVAFNGFGAGKTELLDGFIGSPSAYFSWAQPQDGIAAPADFNSSASAYIKGVWNGSVLPATATLAGPDGGGFYTLTLTGTVIPDSGTMLTAGIGYTYGLASTLPLTQTDLPAYPLTAPPPVTAGIELAGTQAGVACTAVKPCACTQANPCLSGKLIGGLSVPAPNVWAVGTNYTARRTIVASSKCNDCHAKLGVGPTFHAGQRNNAETCSFCHRTSQTNSGWAGNQKDFIHGIHAASKRATPFGWHEASPTEGYWQVTYPGKLNNCESCHVAGSYDFTNAASLAAVPNMLPSTVGTGIYPAPDTTSTAKTSGFLGSVACTTMFPCDCTQGTACVTPHSPYVAEGTDYKNLYATSGTVNGVACTLANPCEASPETLVISPITAACAACHDKPVAIDHMQANGGRFYEKRSLVTGPGAPLEQCMLCHGPNTVAAIADMHSK
jgi:OmcA/MtrC family decaheme c-type cytochrome